jgi:hypothetical protein
MSLTSLENPFERLKTLPTVMNWRGGWDTTEQYYLNDVIIAPLNNATYILTGRDALLGGGDPSLNPDWTELSDPTTGVASVSGSAFITIGGSPTNPQVINNGVCSVSTGLGITNIGTANNTVLINTGITSLQDGLGISCLGNQITNTGIRTLTVGAGLVSSGGNDPSVSNTGIIQLIPSTYIGISAGQTPTITNNGVVQVSPGTGISITGTANIPIINSLTTPPTVSQVFSSINTSVDSVSVPAPPSGTAILFTIATAGLFFQQLQFSGTPTPNGIWLLDMGNHITSLSFTPPNIGIARTLQVSFVDTLTSGGPYSYQPLLSPNQFYGANSVNPATSSLGVFPFDITIARATGMRTISEIRIANNTLGTLDIVSYGSVFATYYPSGLQ